MRYFNILILSVVMVFMTSSSFAHSGGTDANGCHGGSQKNHCHPAIWGGNPVGTIIGAVVVIFGLPLIWKGSQQISHSQQVFHNDER